MYFHCEAILKRQTTPAKNIETHKVPVEDFGSFTKKHETLSVGDDLGGIKSLTNLKFNSIGNTLIKRAQISVLEYFLFVERKPN